MKRIKTFTVIAFLIFLNIQKQTAILNSKIDSLLPSSSTMCDQYNKMNIINKINNLFIKDLEQKSKNCSIQKNLTLKSKDFCLNWFSCYESIVNNGTKLRIKRIDCPCNGKYNTKCNRMYCTLNDEVCETLVKFKENDFKKFSTLRLNKCIIG
jgi:hypothetical protein